MDSTALTCKIVSPPAFRNYTQGGAKNADRETCTARTGLGHCTGPCQPGQGKEISGGHGPGPSLKPRARTEPVHLAR